MHPNQPQVCTEDIEVADFCRNKVFAAADTATVKRRLAQLELTIFSEVLKVVESSYSKSVCAQELSNMSWDASKAVDRYYDNVFASLSMKYFFPRVEYTYTALNKQYIKDMIPYLYVIVFKMILCILIEELPLFLN